MVGFEIVELPVEVTGKEQSGIFQFALAIGQSAFPKIQNGDGGANDNGCDQQNADNGEPIEGIASIKRRSRAIADAVRFQTLLPHWPLLQCMDTRHEWRNPLELRLPGV